MPTKTACNRRDRRFEVSLGENVRVEFQHPSPGGRHYNPPILDISVAGVSFAFDGPAPGLEPGSKITEATLSVGDCKIEGDLLVLHMRSDDVRTVIGALFYPSQDEGLVKLMSVIAGIEAVLQD